MKNKLSVFSFFCTAALTHLYGQAGVFSKDDTSPSAPWQVLMTGATNPNLQLISGVNTSTSPFGEIQAFKQNVGPLPLVFQNAGGFVGIGTSTPDTALTVTGDFHLQRTGGSSFYIQTPSTDVRLFSWGNFPLLLGANGNVSELVLTPSGKVGIGTSTPGTGTTIVGEELDVENGYIRVGHPSGPFFDFYQPGAATDLKFTRIGSVGGDMYFEAINDAYTAPSTRIFIQHGSGNIGIGTNNPTQKLSVNGTIRAKEVIVDTGWADFVFADDYHLTPLKILEGQIKEQRKLPGIPGAGEVSEKGVGVGRVQTMLLAKIEELTLYVIQQQKLIESQSAALEKLNQKVEELSLSQPANRGPRGEHK